MSWTFKIENGDLVRLQGGNGYQLLSGRSKLVQECKMVLSTDVREDGIGSSLSKVIGNSSSGEDEIGQDVPLMFEFQLMARNALNRYKAKQRSTQFSRRLFSELLDDFSPVYITPNQDDPRKFKWRVDFFTMSKSSKYSLGGTASR